MRPPTIVVPLSSDREVGAQLMEATVAETRRALLCREFGVPDDADDEVLNAAIVAAGKKEKEDATV